MSNRHASVDLALNLGWPLLFLWVLSDRFEPVTGLLLALVGPLAATVMAVVRKGKVNPVSVLALVGIGVTGGIGVLQLDARWYAAKEAAIPCAVGALTIASVRTPYPLVRSLLWEVADGARIEAALDARGARAAGEAALARATVGMGAISVILGVVSGVAASFMVTGAPGTPDYNADVASYTAWSFGLINLPSMVATVWVLQRAIDALAGHAGLAAEDLLAPAEPAPPSGK